MHNGFIDDHYNQRDIKTIQPFAPLAPVAIMKRLYVGLVLATFAAVSASKSCAATPDRAGRAPSDWFRVLKLGSGTYAISEPKYWQQNVSYLLLGSTTGILFDTGPGIHSMRTVLQDLTTLPLLVIPSHLHFDHVGRIQEYAHVGLLDLPALRDEVRKDVFTEGPEQYMLNRPYSFRVTRWLHDGETIDLGSRQITVFSTPGHTPESLTLLDRQGHMAFTGDLVNRVVTLCNVPGSNVGQTADSLARLLRVVPEGSAMHEAHSEAPITWQELQLLSMAATEIATNATAAIPMCMGGQPMRRIDVGAFGFIALPSASDERLRPLLSVTETLDWQGDACK